MLIEGGSSLSPARKKEIEKLVAYHKNRVGELSISVQPPDASVSIDGHPIVLDPSVRVRRVAAGRHGIVIAREGYLPRAASVDIRPKEVTELRVALQRQQPAQEVELASIRIDCGVPDVRVSVDGVIVDASSGLLRVTPGDHRVEFSRAGYLPSSHPIQVTATTSAGIDCELRLDPSWPASRRGRPEIALAEPATTWIDGAPSSGQWLPEGRHVIRIAAPGYETWTGEVVIVGGQASRVEPKLRPTLEKVQREAQGARTQRTWAAVAGAGGLALGATATVLYAVNAKRFERWRERRDALDSELRSGERSPEHADRALHLAEDAASLRTIDDLALASGLLGASLVGTSIVLFLTRATATSARAGADPASAGIVSSGDPLGEVPGSAVMLGLALAACRDLSQGRAEWSSASDAGSVAYPEERWTADSPSAGGRAGSGRRSLPRPAPDSRMLAVVRGMRRRARPTEARESTPARGLPSSAMPPAGQFQPASRPSRIRT